MADIICLAVAPFACGFIAGVLVSYVWFKRELDNVERVMSDSVWQCEKDMTDICTDLVDDITDMLKGKGCNMISVELEIPRLRIVEWDAGSEDSRKLEEILKHLGISYKIKCEEDSHEKGTVEYFASDDVNRVIKDAMHGKFRKG